ncbi:hypothetical protein LQV63_29535 [Paenibacillus profundus]|uniref:Transposase n=1 Tax=Paenibacillus profundus TaxID=1173085 RepID=A0ABS8YNI7_9BACL|nr:hypothetical protein [Paenibacillus profundus]MCE5173388.1 hypothetical protein [Paenibacillus profundus]
MGIDEEGHRQILCYYVGAQEGAYGCWREVLKDHYSRGGKVKTRARFKLLEAENNLLKKIYALQRQAKLVKH